MGIRIRRGLLGCIVIVLAIAAVLAGLGHIETGKAQLAPSPSLFLTPSVQPTVKPTVKPTLRPTPTLFVLGPLFNSNLSIYAGPIELPLDLHIPSLNVNAPILGVGLISGKKMDAPKGPIDDPVWDSAFWYRGGGIPGDIGTATIAGHVNDPLGRPEIFAFIQNLQPGDLIIISVRYNSTVEIRFKVNQVKVYSVKESSDPEVLSLIFGAGPVAGLGPQPAPDGLSHLTLITCAGDIVAGEFDHHTVVFATRSN